MTVATQLNIVVANGDNIAVTFPFLFPVYDESHLLVYFQDTTTKVLTLVADSNYSVTGINNKNGGSVVFLAAPVSTVKVIIARVLPVTQDLDVSNQGGFYPENFERELDLLEMQIQQLLEGNNRSIRGQLGEVWPELPPAPQRSGQLVAFSDDVNAYPQIATKDNVRALIASILSAGFGIELNIDTENNIITITNSAPETDAWLLETGTDAASGSAAEIRSVIETTLQGLGCAIVVDEDAGTVTVDLTQDVTTEIIRDAVGAVLVAGSGIEVVVSDVGNTITISADSADFGEIARDAVGAALAEGPGIFINVSDAGDTITISSAPNILSVVSAATVTPTFAYDQVNITAQAANLTLANPTGTIIDGHGILIHLTDDGTSRSITFGGKYRAFNDALPAATTINKTMYIGILYNEADDKWDVLAVREEA